MILLAKMLKLYVCAKCDEPNNIIFFTMASYERNVVWNHRQINCLQCVQTNKKLTNFRIPDTVWWNPR